MSFARSRSFQLLAWVSLSIIASLNLIPSVTAGSVAWSALDPTAIDPMLSQLQQLFAPDGGPNWQFGNSVSISGDTAIVGAVGAGGNADFVGDGAAYVFVRTGGVWSVQQQLTAPDGAFLKNFGASVAISGETIAVGSPGVDLTGAAYVFVRAGGVWTLQQKLLASDRASGDFFGGSVAITGDTVVVAAPLDQVGANAGQGSAYVFARAGGVWSEQQHLVASDGRRSDFFANSVAISGNTVVVGASPADVAGIVDQGAAYVFVREGGAWSEQQILTASDPASVARFGESVAISGDRIVVAKIGSIYVFERTSGAWSERQHLPAPDGGSIQFGRAVAFNGEMIVAGDVGRQIGENRFQGSAHVFASSSGVWSEQQILTASDGKQFDQFGSSVAIDGETIFVGAARFRKGNKEAHGAAYVFGPNTPPTITASSVTIQQGRALSGANSAAVSDNETSASLLTVSVVSGGTATGVTVTNIANTSGTITADIAASCTATIGTVRLLVTDPGAFTSTADLQVNVTPNDPPVIRCPANVIALMTRPGDATIIVSYSAPTVTDDCGVQSVICTPPSGSALPPGITIVSCTASDTSGNRAGCTFSVTVFDVCLQDDTNPSTAIIWNSVTGDYRFCCAGLIYRGRAVVSRKASVFTLTDNAIDRRLIASVDATQNKGTAALQAPPGVNRGTIIDRDIRNNTCHGALAGGP